MSAYSDAMNDKLVEEVKKKLFDRLECQINNYLLHQRKWKILSICLLLIVVYGLIFVMLFSQMRNVHSKHEYFQENLKIEREKLHQMKENLFGLKETAEKNLFKTGPECYQCWRSLLQIDYNAVSAYTVSMNQPIKKSYDETLYPLQRLLILFMYGNIHVMASIYTKPFRLLFLATVLFLINLCIYGELFISHAPSVYYTLTIGIWIFVFSIFLLFKMLMDLLTIISYQTMKKILQSK